MVGGDLDLSPSDEDKLLASSTEGGFGSNMDGESMDTSEPAGVSPLSSPNN